MPRCGGESARLANVWPVFQKNGMLYRDLARQRPGFRRCGEMTGSKRSSNGLDARRRRLLFRAWHRGSREMDLIIGPFADAWIERMSEDEVDAFEQLIALPDPDLFGLIVAPNAAPEASHNVVLGRLRAFHSGARDPR
jgi:antitoxin CptB